MSDFVPSEIIRADAIVHNVRAAGRLTPNHNGEHALLECIEAQQAAIMALGRMVAELQASAAAPVADGTDVPAFLADRVSAPRHGSYWKREEAYAANDVQLPLCIHGEPRNVFCGKCES